jgi:hypothetical protein|tara:strand:- start:43 stop:234 length:192 start_codon:yes stop_codon:yes gene_type:complete
MKRPNVGDRIRHEQIELDMVSTGVVTCILSAQFMYETDEGHTRHCLFKEIWKVENDNEKDKKN